MIPFARILVLSLWAFSAVDQYLGRDASNITNGKNAIDLDWTKQATSAKDYGTKQPKTAGIQNNLASVDDGSLKESVALPFNFSQYQDQEEVRKGENDRCVCDDHVVKEPIQHLQAESLSNACTVSETKTPQVNIGKGVSVPKESAPIEVKPESIINRAGSTVGNKVVRVLALTIVCVSVGLLPKASIQLLLWLQMGCLLCYFMFLRCGQLFARYEDHRRRRGQDDIEQGDRGDSSHLLLTFYDTADLVYQDITRWYRNHGKALNAAVEEHLLRFCSPQREPPPVRGPIERSPGMLVLGPAMTYGDDQRVWGPVEIPVQGPALIASDASATTAAVVAGARPFQGLLSTYDMYSSASEPCGDVGSVCRNIDGVCSRIKEGLAQVYAQLPPFSVAYFRLQRVVEFNMRSLITATRGLDWTKKIDPLDVDMVTVVTVVQPNEDVDDIFNNGVSLVRVEVPSGNEGGSGGKSRQTKEEGGKDRNGNRCLWRLLKKLLAPLTAATPTLIAPPTGGSGSASENGDAEKSPKKSVTTDDWFVASVSELLKLDAAKVSFDALHRLLEFALWPWRQKMAFLFEVAGMIVVDSKSDGHAFLAALDEDLAERGDLCVFQWRVELVVVEKDNKWTEEWKEKNFQWTPPSERKHYLDDEELGPYKNQVGLLNTLWAERTGGLKFKSLPLRVLRAIRNLDAHKHEYPDYVLKQKMWRLVDTLFPSLFPFVAGAVMHKLSELHHRSASSLSKGERWFLMHGTGAWTDAQMSPSNDVKPFLNAVHQLGEARSATSPQRTSN